MILVAAFVAAGIADDKAARPGEPSTFHIPGQPLDLALQAYSRASGVQVLYESELAAGRRSAPVEGSLTPEAALQALLAGTDLVVRYTSSNAITLSRWSEDRDPAGRDFPPSHALPNIDMTLDPLQVVVPAEAAGDEARLHAYGEAVQSDIQNALKRNATTRSGSYRVAVKLWIDAARIVQKTELLQSTGDPQRDIAVSGALRGLVISRAAPPNLPQPVRVVIVVKSL
jgi:Secretin and TonB N terminus short domain